MLPPPQSFASHTPHAALYYSLGEPGPDIRHVWLCLHGHDQPVADLAAQLVNLDTPERLLILPQAPALENTGGEGTPQPARWFRLGSTGPDLAQVRAFLDQLTEYILTTCPPGVPLTVLGYGHGAPAAGAWLAGNRFPYDRLIFYAAVFPPNISRARLLPTCPARRWLW